MNNSGNNIALIFDKIWIWDFEKFGFWFENFLGICDKEGFTSFLKASISIHGSVLLILQKHCKTPLKTQTVHSNSYTTFWTQNIANVNGH